MGLPDVTDKIRAAAAAEAHTSSGSSSSSAAEPTVLQLLQWTMDNTVCGSQAGVAEWASQGCHFAATTGAPELALQEEKLQLDELYGASRAPEPVGQVLSAIADRHRKICSSISSGEAALSPDVANRHLLIQQIEQKGRQLGQGYSVIAGSGLSEEVERELQEEEQQEEEVEVQPPLVTPAAERDWQYKAVLQPGVASVQQLCSTAGSLLSVMQLSEVSERLLAAPGPAGIKWSGKVFCSANFVCTTAASLQKVASGTCSSSSSSSGTANHLAVGSSGGLDEYLRPVDALLLFPSSDEVLLLSEREADALQDLLWKASFSSSSSSSSGVPVLLSLAYARLAAADAPPRVQQQLRLASPLIPTAAVGGGQLRSQSKRMRMSELQDGIVQLVSLLLFNGSASYGSEAQREQLRQVMRGKRGAAEVLLSLRGKSALLARSDLELACDDA
jgi:hypothetical protein